MAAVTKKPNIVFVLCDNVGWWVFGVFQKSVAQYPNIKTGEEFTGHAANA